jgi:hypothetical protein
MDVGNAGCGCCMCIFVGMYVYQGALGNDELAREDQPQLTRPNVLNEPRLTGHVEPENGIPRVRVILRGASGGGWGWRLRALG